MRGVHRISKCDQKEAYGHIKVRWVVMAIGRESQQFLGRTYQQCSAMEKHPHSLVSSFHTMICKRLRGGWSGKTVKTLSAGSSSSLDLLADVTHPLRVCFGFALIGFPSLGCKDDE